ASISNNSAQLRSDIFRTIQKNCQLSEEDLKEIRIVSHNNPVFYEIWVFNDKLSKRKDKTSGLSVIMTQLANGGGVDMNFIGRCHAEEATTFYIDS
ncbi:MAG: hypothetical protein Q9M21_00895, partial [Mariprofundaceae bacterium]|nr:hypothetical protein [Mariprofundaceae bacterium]